MIETVSKTLILQVEGDIISHSSRRLTAKDVANRFACSHCVYMISNEKLGSAHQNHLLSLENSTGSWLPRCVLFALDVEHATTISFMPKLSAIFQALRAKRVFPFKGESSVRMIPFMDVARCREILNNSKEGTDSQENVPCPDPRTIEARIRNFLEAKGILLRKFSARLRCYVHTTVFDRTTGTKATINDDFVSLTTFKRSQMLDTLNQVFVSRKEVYWLANGHLLLK